MFTLAFWKRWHRWIGVPAALLLLHASLTVVTFACTEFFGAEEPLRDASGDGGLLAAMLWATVLVALTVSGLVIYWKIRPKNRTGMQKVFW